MREKYNIEEINRELWEICNDFKEETNAKTNYIEYMSALIYLSYYKNDEFELLKYLYDIKDRFYIDEIIDRNIKEINKKHLFSDIKFANITMYTNTNQYTILSKTIEMLYNLITKIEKKYGNSKKYMAKAYEYILIQAMAKNDMNLENGQEYTPTGIAKVMIGCLNIKPRAQVEDPSCGTGNFIVNIPDSENMELFGKEENKQMYNVCLTNLMLHDINGDNVEYNDFKERSYITKKFDYIISNPPFIQRSIKTKSVRDQKMEYEYGYKNRKLAPGEYSYVLNMFDDLKDDGKMAIILPHGALFRKNERGVRKELIENNYIETIIGLPENMFFGTRISVIIMILSKRRTSEGVLFIDASKEYKSKRKINIFTEENQKNILDIYNKREFIKDYSYVALQKEIADNDYDLTIKKYIKTEIKKTEIDILKTISNIGKLEIERNILEKNITEILEKLYEELKSPKRENIENKEQETDDENMLYLKYKGEKCAKGILEEDGFTILKGSKIANKISPSISKGLIKRVEMCRGAEYVNEGIFIKDCKCKSPSMAATIILGINTNGKTTWKNKEGKSIKELEKND